MNSNSKIVALIALTALIALASSGVWASNAAAARPRPNCGEVVEVGFDNAVVLQTEDHRFFARVRVSNQRCRTVGFALRGNAKDGFWLYSDQFNRWDFQKAGTRQWLSYINYDHRGRPSGSDPPLQRVSRGESIFIWVEIPHQVYELPPGSAVRLWITDSEGWSRSTDVLDLTEYVRHPSPRPEVEPWDLGRHSKNRSR